MSCSALCNSPGAFDESGSGASGTLMFAGSAVGVTGVSVTTGLVISTGLLLVAALFFAAFFAGAFRTVVFAAFLTVDFAVFFAAFRVVLVAPPPRFFAAGLAALRTAAFADFFVDFFVDFFAAARRGRTFPALFFLELLGFRAPFAF